MKHEVATCVALLYFYPKTYRVVETSGGGEIKRISDWTRVGQVSQQCLLDARLVRRHDELSSIRVWSQCGAQLTSTPVTSYR